MRRHTHAEVVPQHCLTLRFKEPSMEDEFQHQQYTYMRKPVQVLILVRMVLNVVAPAYTMTFANATPLQFGVLVAHHGMPFVILLLLTFLPQLCSLKNTR